jgi:hypothetical protein
MIGYRDHPAVPGNLDYSTTGPNGSIVISNHKVWQINLSSPPPRPIGRKPDHESAGTAYLDLIE